MNESATIGDIIGPIVCLFAVWGLYKLLYGKPSGRTPYRAATIAPPPTTSWGTEIPHTPHTPQPQQRTIIAVLDNPHAHPYDNLPLTELHDHLFNDHFEVWNLIVEKGGPERYRREHALDHGMVLR